jgi:hypothetical protein
MPIMIVLVAASTALSVACATILDIGGDYHRAAPSGDGGGADSAGAADAAAVCDADLSDDPESCGACGRSCQGATCTNGRCAAQSVAADFTANALAVDDTSIFWTDQGDGTLGGGAVSKCSKPACGDRASLASLTQPVAVDAMKDSVFVLASKDLAGGLAPHGYRVPKSGGTPIECLRSGSPATQSSMSAAGDRVFVAQKDSIDRCDDACTDCDKVLGEKTTSVIANANDHLFWLGVDTDRTGLRRCALGGATCVADPLTNASVAPTEVTSLAADEASVFAAVSGKIVTVDRTSGELKTLASIAAQSSVRLAQDADAVYVSTNSAIVRVPKDGRPPLTIVDVASSPAFAVDGTHVYYVDPTARSLSRVAK